MILNLLIEQLIDRLIDWYHYANHDKNIISVLNRVNLKLLFIINNMIVFKFTLSFFSFKKYLHTLSMVNTILLVII